MTHATAPASARRAPHQTPAAVSGPGSAPLPTYPGADDPRPSGSSSYAQEECCRARRNLVCGRLLHTAEQAGQLLALPAHWLQRAAAEGRIPATYLGRYLRFSNADLDAIITGGHRPAAPAT